MSNWPSSKANRVLAALYRIGWTLKRQSGSHKTLSRPGWPDVVFAFHDREEIVRELAFHVMVERGLADSYSTSVAAAFYACSTNYLVDVEAGVIVDVEATTALRYAWLVR